MVKDYRTDTESCAGVYGLLYESLKKYIMATITSEKIAALFPFSFTVDAQLNITGRGKSLTMLPSVHCDFNTCFEIVKPDVGTREDFTSIAKHAGEHFVLKTNKTIVHFDLAGTFIADDAGGFLFIGSPYIDSAQALLDSHLENVDFGLLDRTKELIRRIEESESSSGDLHKENASLARKIDMLEEKDRQLNNFFNLSLDFMCLANTEGYFTKVNPTFCSILGYTEKELLENSFLSFVHPEDLPNTMKVIERLSHGELTINFENRYRKADGSYIVMSWNCTPDPSTGVLYATARDMTEHNMVIQKEKELIVEKERTELNKRMLEKLLPTVIVKRFQLGEREIADYYPQVSILFADIVDFSSIVKLMPAMVVRKFLTMVFEHFDNIVRNHRCEKIKTIGDGYLAIAGAPEPCENHSELLTAAALEMIKPFELPEEITEYVAQDKYLTFRIGMHVGAIVGGVLGTSRPMSYDIWGDAVNIASRMQSTGEPGKIHVTSDFVMHLKNRCAQSNDCVKFRFEKRGNIEVKHMGRIFTYYITDEVKIKTEGAKRPVRISPIVSMSIRKRVK
jgi:PAS domain S-box-containing protein